MPIVSSLCPQHAASQIPRAGLPHQVSRPSKCSRILPTGRRQSDKPTQMRCSRPSPSSLPGAMFLLGSPNGLIFPREGYFHFSCPGPGPIQASWPQAHPQPFFQGERGFSSFLISRGAKGQSWFWIGQEQGPFLAWVGVWRWWSSLSRPPCPDLTIRTQLHGCPLPWQMARIPISVSSDDPTGH